MDANSSTINRFKAQANKFSEIIGKGLGKTTQTPGCTKNLIPSMMV
jgi:hypothetical protein